MLSAICTVAFAVDKGDTESKLGKVRSKIEELQRTIRTDTNRRDSVAARLRDAELSVAEARKSLDRVRSQRNASAQRRGELQAQRREAERELAQERQSLAGQLRTAYTLGREEQLRLLLNQQDPARLGRMFVYYGYFGRSRAEKIAAIDAQLAKLAELESRLSEENATLAQLEDQAQTQLNNLQNARSERAEALGALEQDLKGRKGELARLKREEGELRKLLAELQRVMSDFPMTSEEPFVKAKGRLGWPVNGRIVADFGQQRAAGLKWDGVLLATERGSQVRAVYFGRVIYADWLAGLGLLTIVQHSGGYLSLYGYNEQLYKSVGDMVKPGEAIAAAGDSGGRNRPELYFEIRKGSQPLNPHQWIKKK